MSEHVDRPGTLPLIASLAQVAIGCGAPAPLRQMLEIRFTQTFRQFGDGGYRDLLEAIRNVVHVHHNGTVIDMETAIEQCEAAIAKATGAQP